MKRFILVLSVLCVVGFGWGGRSLWDMSELSRVPQIHISEDSFGADDLTAIFYEAEPFKGKPTRVFAYLGLPKGASAERPVPGVVLAHGGGGTAYAEWVRIWNQRGYAAIAMDTDGTVPKGKYPDRPTHEYSGPNRIEPHNGLPPREQWFYHAVADVILAHSLLRARPQVDPGRVGLTGISWGGFKTCIASAIDQRFAFAIPVYGCGFQRESGINKFVGRFKDWDRLWDPSNYLPQVRVPMLWVTGTNDAHYYLGSFQKSYRITASPLTQLAVWVRMAHSHPAGWQPQEIYAFADQILQNGTPLIRITDQGRNGNMAWTTFDDDSEAPAVKAELNFTKDTGEWVDRQWDTIPAKLDKEAKKITSQLPEGTRVYYFNITDSRDLISSSPHVELD